MWSVTRPAVRRGRSVPSRRAGRRRILAAGRSRGAAERIHRSLSMTDRAPPRSSRQVAGGAASDSSAAAGVDSRSAESDWSRAAMPSNRAPRVDGGLGRGLDDDVAARLAADLELREEVADARRRRRRGLPSVASARGRLGAGRLGLGAAGVGSTATAEPTAAAARASPRPSPSATGRGRAGESSASSAASISSSNGSATSSSRSTSGRRRRGPARPRPGRLAPRRRRSPTGR